MDQIDVFDRLERFAIPDGIRRIAREINRRMLSLLEEGERDKDLKKIYDFVSLLERCGEARPSIPLREIITEAWKVDKPRLIAYINGKSRIVDIVQLVYCLDDNMKIDLLQNTDINKLLKFELVRQKLENSNLGENDDIIVAKNINEIASVDPELFSFFIQLLHNKPKYYQVMGKALNDMQTEGLRVFARNIEIDRYGSQIENVSVMLNNISDNKKASIYSDIMVPLLQKWGMFLETLQEKKNI